MKEYNYYVVTNLLLHTSGTESLLTRCMLAMCHQCMLAMSSMYAVYVIDVCCYVIVSGATSTHPSLHRMVNILSQVVTRQKLHILMNVFDYRDTDQVPCTAVVWRLCNITSSCVTVEAADTPVMHGWGARIICAYLINGYNYTVLDIFIWF